MPEARDPALVRWGDALRRSRLARRDRRARGAAAAIAAATATLLVATIVERPQPAFVWNSSGSAPQGLYRIEHRAELRVGDISAARIPAEARELAASRHYLPASIPVVKRVAATGGDRVCAIGETLWINGRPSASRQGADPSGRPLPWWTGCMTLGRGEYLLLADHRDSFDGRYFGLVSSDDLIGRAILLWP